ncbi:MAG: mercury(II) reductase [Alphaproteobacteria bacterium]|nr:MAG: mercury(II) reductase [Alphaproteobacteria bacterium]
MTDDCCAGGGDAFDLAVIGAGSAGFSAAITAAEAGLRVALIGHGTIGGTCVNVGCVPSKAMIRAAEAVHGGAAAARFPGIGACRHAVDWPAVIAGKDALVAALRERKYADLLPVWPGIRYVEEGPATLEPGGVRVGGRLLRAPRVIIATGSRPSVPAIPGIGSVPTLDSTTLLALDRLPRSLIFLGGGYVGAELAQMMARMGVEVTMVCRSDLLPRAEPEASAALAAAFRAEGITLHCGLRPTGCRAEGGRAVLTLEDGARGLELAADHLVLATGRIPNTEGLGLSAMGIATDRHGAIVVGDDMQTSRPGIYAAGDVTDRDRFVYMAALGGRIAALNAMGGDERCDNAAMPWVVFTDPQLAGVGLTEAAARAAGFEVRSSVLGLDALPRALAARDSRGVIKLVADARTDRLLGGVICAPEGADSIQTLALALRFGMRARDLAATVFPYLTTVEGLKLAAQGFQRDIARLSCCAG